MSLADEQFIALTTYRRTGAPVPTPVWVVPVMGGRLGFYTTMGTGKTKRLKHTDRVSMQPCGRRGEADPGALTTTGTARMVHSGPDFEAVHAAVKAKYGFEYQLVTKLIGPLVARRKGLHYGDTVVLITPEQ